VFGQRGTRSLTDAPFLFPNKSKEQYSVPDDLPAFQQSVPNSTRMPISEMRTSPATSVFKNL